MGPSRRRLEAWAVRLCESQQLDWRASRVSRVRRVQCLTRDATASTRPTRRSPLRPRPTECSEVPASFDSVPRSDTRDPRCMHVAWQLLTGLRHTCDTLAPPWGAPKDSAPLRRYSSSSTSPSRLVLPIWLGACFVLIFMTKKFFRMYFFCVR